MTKIMLPMLICLLYISANVRGLSENSQGDRFELILGHSSGVKEEVGRVFQANAYARGNCEFDRIASLDRNCTAIVTYFDRKRVIGEHSCGVMKLITPIDGRSEHHIRFLFQKNKAIFVHEYQNENGLYQQYQMVEPHSDGCAKYSTAPINLGSHLTLIRQMNIALYSNIIVHDNGNYDIITYGDCGGARCIYSFVNENKSVRGHPYLPQMYQDYVVKVFPSTKSDAHFTIVSEWQSSYRDRHQPTQNYFSNIGFSSEKLLYVQRGIELAPIQLASFYYGNTVIPEILVDNSNGLFSLCRNRRVGINHEVHCMQFDERDMIFNKTTILSYSERLLTIYNIPKGGILLVKTNCQSESMCRDLLFETKTLNSNDEKEYDLLNVQFKLPISKTIVHVEDDNQLCITMYNDRKQQSPGYDLFVKCFSNPFFMNGASAQNYISLTFILTCVTMLFFTVTSI